MCSFYFLCAWALSIIADGECRTLKTLAYVVMFVHFTVCILKYQLDCANFLSKILNTFLNMAKCFLSCLLLIKIASKHTGPLMQY